MGHEIWKPVVGFEEYYEVSDAGRVRSLRSGQIRKPVPNQTNGYLTMVLHGDNFKKTMTVHRIVAQAFCEKPANCDFVNHKDENKHNNNASNLEWVTKAYNNAYNGKDQRCNKAIEQLDEDFNLIRRWSSARKACEATGIEYKNISSVCRGLRPRAGGFRWRFATWANA